MLPTPTATWRGPSPKTLNPEPLNPKCFDSDLEGAIPASEVQHSVLCEHRSIQSRRQVRCSPVSGQSAAGLKESIVWLVDSLKRGLQQRGGGG